MKAALLRTLRRAGATTAGRLVHRWFQHGVGVASAALAYYMVFSFFPFLIFLSALLSLLNLPALPTASLQNLLPLDIINIANAFLTHSSQVNSGYLVFWGLLFTIYFTMRAVSCLLRAVYRAYRAKEARTALGHQVVVFLTTLFLMFTVFFSLVLLTVGRRALEFLARFIHISPEVIGAWNIGRFLLLAVILFFALALVYYTVPNRRFSFLQVLPGTLAALVSWLAISVGFAYYVENMGSYSVIYGSIGAVIVLLLWLYFSAATLIMGAELNNVILKA